MIYDFMSFVSMYLSGLIIDMGYSLEKARETILLELYGIHTSLENSVDQYDAFHAVALSIEPSPVYKRHSQRISKIVVVEPAVDMQYDDQSTPQPSVLQYGNRSTPPRSTSSASSHETPMTTPVNAYDTPRSASSIATTTPLPITPVNLRQTRLFNQLFSPTSTQSYTPPRFNVLIQHTIGSMNTRVPSRILDTGATVCGAGVNEQFDNVSKCSGVTVHGAFGKAFQPSMKGTILGDLQLECLRLPGQGDTLISVSALCRKGYCVVFTDRGCSGYLTSSVLTALSDMSKTGKEIIRGEQRDGLYHMVPRRSTIAACVSNNAVVPPTVSGPHRVLYTNAQPASHFEHLHASLGHPGSAGMEYHRSHTPGAQFSDDDANAPRGLCTGCLLGGMRQVSTDHKRTHRKPPSRPGQQFVLDAFSCTTTSRSGFKFCDILTDMNTHIRYPVFTKNRSAEELCDKATVLFNLHPEWQANNQSADRIITIDDADPAHPDDTRYIRVDAESNYSSTEFLQCAATHKYLLERTPPRDKHANGAAERSVGLVTLKTNVVMMAPTPPVPLNFWPEAMAYVCDTL